MNITEIDFAYLILTPEDFYISIENQHKLIKTENQDLIEIITDSHFHYSPKNEDKTFTWEFPGIKLIFKKEISIDDAKNIAEEIVSNLKDISEQNFDLVLLDLQRLAQS